MKKNLQLKNIPTYTVLQAAWDAKVRLGTDAGLYDRLISQFPEKPLKTKLEKLQRDGFLYINQHDNRNDPRFGEHIYNMMFITERGEEFLKYGKQSKSDVEELIKRNIALQKICDRFFKDAVYYQSKAENIKAELLPYRDQWIKNTLISIAHTGLFQLIKLKLRDWWLKDKARGNE